MEPTVVRSIVKFVFPEDYAVIGETNRNHLFTANETRSVTISDGHPFSVKEPLEIVAAAIVIVRQLLLIAEEWKAKNSRLPTPNELSGSLPQSELGRSAEVAKHLSEIVDAVLKALSAKE